MLQVLEKRKLTAVKWKQFTLLYNRNVHIHTHTHIHICVCLCIYIGEKSSCVIKELNDLDSVMVLKTL